MDDSPLTHLLRALDERDEAAALALMAGDCDLLLADGRRAQGRDEVARLLAEFVSMTRSMRHETVAEWHLDDVWIAEVKADYELRDWLQLPAVPRAFVLRAGPGGITSLHAYGAREPPLSDHRTGDEGMRIGDRWIPPL